MNHSIRRRTNKKG